MGRSASDLHRSLPRSEPRFRRRRPRRSIGDGVHFVVRVNGCEVWRHFRATGPGWEELAVPLGEYAGRTVVLTLGLDAGPAGFNLSCDNTWWGDVTLQAD